MKYINAERLYKQVDELMARFAKLEKEAEPDTEDLSIFYQGKKKMCSELLGIINSLQKDFPTADEQVKEFLATHPKIKVPEKYKNPDWLFKNQEQSEVNLEKEIDKYCELIQAWQIQEAPYTSIENCARHFYELGRKGGSK